MYYYANCLINFLYLNIKLEFLKRILFLFIYFFYSHLIFEWIPFTHSLIYSFILLYNSVFDDLCSHLLPKFNLVCAIYMSNFTVYVFTYGSWLYLACSCILCSAIVKLKVAIRKYLMKLYDSFLFCYRFGTVC